MDEKSVAPKEIQAVIDFLKQEVASKRTAHIKKRIEENAEKIVYVTDNFYKLSTERRNPKIIGSNHSVGLLSKRQKDAIDLQNVIGTSNGDEDSSSFQEDGYASSTIPLAVPPIKLPEVKRLPHCTTWIFLHKNQRMTEDQSLIGRRRIYYDREGGEALICSDSEDETVEKEEEKKDFAESEDCILRVTAKEFGISDVVLDLLAQCFSRKPCEVKERYEDLIKEVNDSSNLNDVNDGNIDGTSRSYLDKDLDTALDSFDYLFCRRCYVFDCRLHGCSQELVFPAEKQLPWCPPDAEKDPCGPNCFRLVLNLEGNATAGSPGQGNYEEKLLPPGNGGSQVPGRKSAGLSVQMRSKSPSTRKFWMASPASDDDESLQIGAPGCPQQDNVLAIQTMASNVDTLRKEEFADESTYKIEVNGDQSWKPMEVALCEKGQEIFGMNSCLIARNLMNGWKTCLDVFMYMNSSENKPFSQPGENALVEGCKVDGNETVGKGVRRRSTFLRRRVRVRRLMCNWKSAGYRSVRKPISERKGLPYIQYNPCTCQSPCGKDCPCLVNGTCCEKYCGCPKSCKNRFKGCYCVKSLCRSRQCPCFAADRECDPDVCRNCSISCGDGTVGVPFQRGDNYECGNMKLLLQQQERVLLGRSDVSGWGAFLKNSVAKDEYLGEYTGELISHSEADKRGKIYDHENKSFLFNLNDQFVLDAYGMGNKLKFANHSPDPNCYAKVIKVSGDHRVGIFAKEEICAGEELFFDYCYKPDAAPAWARKPEEASAGPSSSRPKKHT